MTDNQKYIAGFNEALWRLPRVLEAVGVSKAQWWRWVQKGFAPKGINVSRRVTFWRASEIQEFIEKLATTGLVGTNEQH